MSNASPSGRLSRVLQISTGAFRATGGFLRKRVWLVPILGAVVLGVIAWGVSILVEQSLQERLRQELTTVRNADVTALKTWLQLQKAEAESLANTPMIRQAVHDLIRVAGNSPRPEAALRDSKPLADLRAHLQPTVRAMGYDGFSVIGPQLMIMASDHDVLVGQSQVPHLTDFIKTVFDGGEPAVSVPVRSILMLAPVPDDKAPSPPESGERKTGLPIMLAAAPVRDEGKIIAVFALRIRPEKDFTSILRVAKYGDSGETYAFDDQGLLLSQSRFDDQLKEIGLLPNVPDARSILTLQLRDPGVNLAAGERPTLKTSEQALTRMAVSATAHLTDVNVAGYRDYRGVPVVGAWTWLDGYNFGVATEVDADEAYRPLKIIRATFWGLFGLLVLCAAGLFVLSLIVSWQQREMQRTRKLGQYTLEDKLGEGGMGVVYKAKHALLRRPTAIKLLNSAEAGADDVARFEREVQMTSQLEHPNTIAIYDYGRTPDGVFYYAMEYLAGINLEDLVMRHGALPEGRVIYLLQQVCGSLAEAHGIGLIHRDVKPANIVISHRGGLPDFVKVLDFGLVKAVGGDVQLTSKDVVIGTPLYMAPEAIEHPEKIDLRADVYAVGAVGYYLLTGSPVFAGRNTLEICRKHLKDQPQRPSERINRPVSGDLEAVILRCLAKDPSDRPAQAALLAEELARCAAAAGWTRADAEKWWETRKESGTAQSDTPQPAGNTAVRPTRPISS